MLHGRVLRPDAPRAQLLRLDEVAVRAVPGFVALVHDGNFLGVVAETEEAAEAALARLRAGAQWSEGEVLPDESSLAEWLKSQPVETKVVATREAPSPSAPVRTVRRAYTRPFIAHGSIAPSCAIAQWNGDTGVHVWSHCQGVYNLRSDLSLVLGLKPESIVVEHVEGAGCYGHNGADDVALDAVLLARAANGRPVRVQWSRADELARAPFGAAMLVEIEADLDRGGGIVGWRHSIWGNGHVGRPGRNETPTLLAASELEKPFPRFIATNPPLATGGGADRNSVPLYDVPYTVTSHRLLTMPLRTSALRSLGAFANVFAIESFLDELAAERGEDPLALRLRHLSDPRARAVLEAAARAGWAAWRPREGAGHGLAFARYKGTGAWCAVVAEVEVAEAVRMRRLVVAVDVGEAVNPDGVMNQIEGGAIQAASWTLKEAVRFDRDRVTSDAWENYPILTFSEVPAVEVEIVNRPDERPVGAGEAAHGPTAAAIANAVFHALGVRVRDLPITRERILAAVEAGA
jgi:CO/xanthine dehydrogenase Mo-binding subunit